MLWQINGWSGDNRHLHHSATGLLPHWRTDQQSSFTGVVSTVDFADWPSRESLKDHMVGYCQSADMKIDTVSQKIVRSGEHSLKSTFIASVFCSGPDHVRKLRWGISKNECEEQCKLDSKCRLYTATSSAWKGEPGCILHEWSECTNRKVHPNWDLFRIDTIVNI